MATAPEKEGTDVAEAAKAEAMQPGAGKEKQTEKESAEAAKAQKKNKQPK